MKEDMRKTFVKQFNKEPEKIYFSPLLMSVDRLGKKFPSSSHPPLLSRFLDKSEVAIQGQLPLDYHTISSTLLQPPRPPNFHKK